MLLKILTSGIVFLSVIPVFADVRIYLYPRCEFEGQSLKFENIAWIDGDSEAIERIKKIQISDITWKDGYVDRREIDNILKNEQIGLFSVIGNSVRVKKSVGVRAEKEKIEKMAEQSVKKGDQVTVLVVSRKITLKTHGLVSKSAFPGDEVPVEISKKRFVRGILKEDRVVEVRI
jgi:hypothetical protein